MEKFHGGYSLDALQLPEIYGSFKPVFAGKTLSKSHTMVYTLVFPAVAGNIVFMQGCFQYFAVVRIHSAILIAPPEEGGGYLAVTCVSTLVSSTYSRAG